jgi:beta-barrel assembly-enhancing protease
MMLDSSQEFQGGVFHDSIPGGRAGAKVSMTLQEIVAVSQGDDPQRFSIRINECQLDMGGSSGRMIFCRDPSKSLTIFCEEPAFAKALDQGSMGMLSEQLSTLRKQQRGDANRFRFWLTVSALIFAFVCFTGYYGVLAAARATVRALPISIDEKIGKMAIQSMALEKRLDADHLASKFVSEIVETLKPHALIKEMDFQVMVIDSDEVNAFALPGGQMVVYTGLIKKASSSEQVAGVIAHEISHATLRHGLQSLSQSLGIVAAIQFMTGDMGGLIALGSHVAQESVLTSYSRNSETEADLEGARMLHAANIDPKAMAEFFELLKEEEGDIPGLVAWISTHPQHSKRVENISNYEKTLTKKEYARLELDLEKVQKELKH